jgi:hypothetical protein
MKTFFRAILFLVTILFISCGEEKTEVPKKKEVVESKVIDACSLLDKSEIEKIFAVEMKEPKKGRSKKGEAGSVSFSECSFESNTEGSKIYLSVYIRFTPSIKENQTTLQSVRNSFKQSGIVVTDINGVGDVTFWGGNQLHVFKGENYYFIITLLGIKEQDEAIQKTTSVSRNLIDKLYL